MFKDRIGQLQEPRNISAVIVPDLLDRTNEILRSAIDMEYRIASRIREAIDKMIGPTPDAPEAMPDGGDTASIANLLGDLERAQSYTQRQLDRLREGKI